MNRKYTKYVQTKNLLQNQRGFGWQLGVGIILNRKYTLGNKTALKQKGPLLIVANHPDSFFDALVIAANCTYPVSFLARGDVFTKPWHNFLLRALNMMPVYRQREGKEHLHKNQKVLLVQRLPQLLADSLHLKQVCLKT